MDLKDIRLYLDDRPQDGVFRVHRNAFHDPEVFEMEMKYIFERVWNFLGLETQLRKPHDFFTTHVGRTPLMVSRAPSVINGMHIIRRKDWGYEWMCPRNSSIKDSDGDAVAPNIQTGHNISNNFILRRDR